MAWTPPPTLRLPIGGYLQAATAARASSRLLTIGTTTPCAPLSRTRLMCSWRLAGTRASAVQPASATDAKMCVAVSQSTRLCSMSTVNQANPDRAKNRAAVMLPSDNHVPTDGWPAFKDRLTGFARMSSSHSGDQCSKKKRFNTWDRIPILSEGGQDGNPVPRIETTRKHRVVWQG